MSRLYTRAKIFHFKEKLDSLPRAVEKILPPLHIRIKPTNLCNHNCSYCAYRADNLQLGRDMVRKDQIPREKMMEIIDDLIEMQVKAVTFSGGGEPFCYPHLTEVVTKLARSPIKFAALTNGSRLEGEVADIFAHHGTWLRVSIDGWEELSYSTYRNVSQSEFTKVIRNMANFKKLGGPCYLGVSFIIDETNAGHVLEFITRLRDTGVDSVKVSPCIIDNDGAKNNRYHRPFFEKVKKQVHTAREQMAGDRFEIYDAYHELDEKFKKNYHWCPYLQILPVIGADQKIYSCQDKAYNLKEGLIGSIEHQRFRDFWFTDKNKFFKIDPARHCDHHCVANEKNRLVLEYLEADPNHLGFV
ncbi:MAG: radical SAM protein [Sedimentisphaerales bacterium]|nr:radical SAM protein [Sedimentisphaerales bacterium]